MPASRAELLAFLDELGIASTTHEHEAVFTVSESTEVHERMPGGHTKNLFLKDKKGRIFLVVALHDAEIDLKTLHQKIGAQGRLSFGKPELPDGNARRRAWLGDAFRALQRPRGASRHARL